VIHKGELVTEGTVDELRGGGGILLKADPLEEARKLAASLAGVRGARIEDGMLVLDTDPELAAEINARLVSAGVRVGELRPVERSLEDAFLELTRGETI